MPTILMMSFWFPVLLHNFLVLVMIAQPCLEVKSALYAQTAGGSLDVQFHTKITIATSMFNLQLGA